jgi:DNA modification methylase
MQPNKPQIEHLALDALVPYARNSRTHSPEQVAQIAGSIKEFGFTNPVLIDADGGIIAGHGRVMAARKLGLSEVPCIRLGYLTETQKRAYVIADNKLALNAGWDEEMLRLELGDLREADVDLSLVGFTEEEIGVLLAEKTEGETDPDEVPEPPADPITKPGDLWMLGEHRLLCGDSTNAKDVERLMAGAKAQMMITDPPYGVEYDPSWRAEVNEDGPDSKRALGTVANDDRADWTEAWQLFDGDVAYVWHADRYSPVVAGSLEATGLEVRYLIVWAKQRHTFGRGHYHHQHEPCWCVVRKGATASWAGDRTQTTLWQIDNNRHNDTGHGTQKPVECMARPMRNHQAILIYDPFLGSGTTLIAAEQLGRKCYGMEISPQYCDVIIRRWQDFTGQQAVHEASGKTFNELSAAKAKA